MKKIIALLLVAVMCLAIVGCNSGSNSQNPNNNANSESGGNNPNKDILGEWYSVDFEGMCVKFSDNNTGECSEGSHIFDFEWEYDKENENYRTNIAGQRVTFKTRTEEGLTFLDSSWGYYFFKEEECEVAMEKAGVLRDNYINRQLKDKTLLPVGEEIHIGNAIIVFDKIEASEHGVSCSYTVTAKKDITSSELNQLLVRGKQVDFYEHFVFLRSSSKPVDGSVKISDNDLVAGESLNKSISYLFTDVSSDFPKLLEKWGKCHGYAVIKCGETEYYINFGEYIKQQ